jgi:hypothetical protein
MALQTMITSRQLLSGNHLATIKDTNATTEELFKAALSVQSVQTLHNEKRQAVSQEIVL